MGLSESNANPFRKSCPLCETTARTFIHEAWDYNSKHRIRDLKLPGQGIGRNEYCPTCGSSSRERLLHLYLLRYTDVFTPTAPMLRVVACGELPRLADVITKISRVELAEEGVMGLFDIVIENQILERAANDREKLLALRNQLIPSGRLIISEAISPVLPATLEDEGSMTERKRRRAFGDPKRKRVFGADFEARIREAELIPEPFDWRTNRGRFGGLRNRFALEPGQRLMICRRGTTAQSGRR